MLCATAGPFSLLGGIVDICHMGHMIHDKAGLFIIRRTLNTRPTTATATPVTRHQRVFDEPRKHTSLAWPTLYHLTD